MTCQSFLDFFGSYLIEKTEFFIPREVNTISGMETNGLQFQKILLTKKYLCGYITNIKHKITNVMEAI